MNCKETLYLITSFSDGELPLDIYYSVERHLKTCPNCAEQLKNEELSKGLLAKHVTCYQPSQSFKNKIYAEISKHHNEQANPTAPSD